MAIDLRCPECGRPARAPEGAEGKRARCSGGAVFRIAPKSRAGDDPTDPLAVLGISLEERPEREGSLLVMSPDAVLPDRCVKCNAPAEGRRLLVTLRRG